MSKKIKDEDGNVYIKKKPFYKRIWFWLLVVVVLIIGSQMGNSDSSSDSNKSSSSSSKVESNSSTTTSSSTSSSTASTSSQATNGLTKENFDKIVISDSSGTSENDVKSMFKKTPESTDTQTIDDTSANMYTWSGVKNGDITSTVVIGFENGHAISKDISGLKVKRAKKITLAQFNSIQNGLTKAEVQKQLGDPNGYSLVNILDSSSEDWNYTSGIQGDFGANFSITFTDGKVSGKNQMSMN